MLRPAAHADYKKRYRLAKIPLLSGDDIFIPESTIVIEYLENEFPAAGHRRLIWSCFHRSSIKSK